MGGNGAGSQYGHTIQECVHACVCLLTPSCHDRGQIATHSTRGSLCACFRRRASSCRRQFACLVEFFAGRVTDILTFPLPRNMALSFNLACLESSCIHHLSLTISFIRFSLRQCSPPRQESLQVCHAEQSNSMFVICMPAAGRGPV